MILRPARTDEAGALALIFHRAVQIGAAKVYSQAQRDDWSPDCPTAERWAERLMGLTTFVAEVDGVPQAFLSMDDRDGLIDLMFVTPERIGQGLAYTLYQAALDHARTVGLRRLHVVASAQSRVFFARQGWSEIGRRNHGEGEALVVATLMELNLR